MCMCVCDGAPITLMKLKELNHVSSFISATSLRVSAPLEAEQESLATVLLPTRAYYILDRDR